MCRRSRHRRRHRLRCRHRLHRRIVAHRHYRRCSYRHLHHHVVLLAVDRALNIRANTRLRSGSVDQWSQVLRYTDSTAMLVIALLHSVRYIRKES